MTKAISEIPIASKAMQRVNLEISRKLSQRASSVHQVWIVVVPPGRTIRSVLGSNSIPRGATLCPRSWHRCVIGLLEKLLSDRSFQKPESPMRMLASEFSEAERLVANLQEIA